MASPPDRLSLRRAPRTVHVVLVLTLVLIGAYCVSVLPGMPGRPGTSALWEGWIRPAAYAGAALVCALRAVVVRERRAPWVLLAAAVGSYTLGYLSFGIVYGGDDHVPYVSFADALWLAFYPLSYGAIVLLVRDRARHFRRSMWLDGLVAGLAVAALSASVAFEVLISDVGGQPIVVAVNLAYPIADLLLITLVVCVFGVTGWRPGRAWLALGAGLLINSVADTIYLLQAARDTYVEGTWLDAMWLFAFLGIGIAAWQPVSDRRAQLGEWRALAVPSVSTLVAVAVLAVPGLSGEHRLAVLLATAAVLVSVGRTALTFREVRQLAASRNQALTDELTGLPNRRALAVRLEEATGEGQPAALLFLGVDRFKELNDTLGHHVGDLLLERLGHRLAEATTDGDVLARLGGDEFAVLLADGAAATETAMRLRRILERPFTLDGIPVQVDASVGVACFPEHGRTAIELLKHADVAMHQAKQDHTGIARYHENRNEHSRDRLALLGDLRSGIARGELVLHYQPQVDVETGRLSGLEALVRWEHPQHELLMPPAFLPAVEQTSLMHPLTERVLSDALHQAASWAGGPLDVPVSVNIAAPNLLDTRFPETVARLLRRSGVAPQRLRIEVTENAVMTDVERATAVLARIRELGVRISIDDFGTGHSSLARLKHLPVDELKIDKGFVLHVEADERDAAVVEAAVTLAHRLRLTVVAEGVETPEALALLRRLGCHLAQGFLLSRPLAPWQLERWIRSRADVPSITKRAA
jgi:diguanylate cyclase (GGDEF)-like protein